MVGQEDDERPVVDTAFAQRSEESADDRVGCRDLAVVRARGVLRGKRLRGRVRRVGLVEVEEREHRFLRILPRPAVSSHCSSRRACRLPGAGPVRLREAGLAHLDRVVPEFEPLGDAARMVEHDGGDGPAGRVAARPEQGRDRRRRRGEPVAEVVADSVDERELTREERRVRGQGQGNLGNGRLEDDAVPREGVDGGSFDAAIPVSGNVVRPERVDRDQENGGRRKGRPAATGGRPGRCRATAARTSGGEARERAGGARLAAVPSVISRRRGTSSRPSFRLCRRPA